MIIMADWLRWKRMGLDLFTLSPDVLAAVWSLYGGEWSDFVADLSSFFSLPYNDGDKSDGSDTSKRIRPEDVWKILARVDDWERLSWGECVALSMADAENRAAERSEVLCLIHNVNCSKRADQKKPEDFNAFAISRKLRNFKKLRRQYYGGDDSAALNEALRGLK